MTDDQVNTGRSVDLSSLRVIRRGHRSAHWPWSKSEYVVYLPMPDGTEIEVLSGFYKNHYEAVQEARNKLRSAESGS